MQTRPLFACIAIFGLAPVAAFGQVDTTPEQFSHRALSTKQIPLSPWDMQMVLQNLQRYRALQTLMQSGVHPVLPPGVSLPGSSPALPNPGTLDPTLIRGFRDYLKQRVRENPQLQESPERLVRQFLNKQGIEVPRLPSEGAGPPGSGGGPGDSNSTKSPKRNQGPSPGPNQRSSPTRKNATNPADRRSSRTERVPFPSNPGGSSTPRPPGRGQTGSGRENPQSSPSNWPNSGPLSASDLEQAIRRIDQWASENGGRSPGSSANSPNRQSATNSSGAGDRSNSSAQNGSRARTKDSQTNSQTNSPQTNSPQTNNPSPNGRQKSNQPRRPQSIRQQIREIQKTAKAASRERPTATAPESDSGIVNALTGAIDDFSSDVVKNADRLKGRRGRNWISSTLNRTKGAWRPVQRRMSDLVGDYVPSGSAMSNALPDFSPPDVSVPDVDAASAGNVFVILVLVAVVGVVGYFIARASIAERNQNDPPRRKPGLIPVHNVVDRSSLVRACDALALWRFGREADTWNPAQVFDKFQIDERDRVEMVDDLEAVYEQARYAPTERVLSADQLLQAKSSLRSLGNP